MRRFFSSIVVLLIASLPAHAHEVRPAYLEIGQPEADLCRIVWKRPMTGELGLRLIPHLSNGWMQRRPDDQYSSAGFMIQTWSVRPCSAELLAGTSIEIEGLNLTITDVFVRVRLGNGWREDVVLRPDSARFTLPAAFHPSNSVPAYLAVGVEHILSGVDHLLFVLGLILLIRARWMLLKAVTAFTVAHSITLASALLLDLTLPSGLVEALISLSILFLATEVLRARQGGTSLTLRFPWAVAFAFGLFHGMGFAGGLIALGYAQQDLAVALVSFNLGVELGQVGFIGIVLLLGRLWSSHPFGKTELVARAPAYVVGIAGAYWTCLASAALLGVG